MISKNLKNLSSSSRTHFEAALSKAFYSLR